MKLLQVCFLKFAVTGADGPCCFVLQRAYAEPISVLPMHIATTHSSGRTTVDAEVDTRGTISLEVATKDVRSQSHDFSMTHSFHSDGRPLPYMYKLICMI